MLAAPLLSAVHQSTGFMCGRKLSAVADEYNRG